MSNLRGHIISTVRLYPDMIVSLLSAEATDDEVLHRSKEPASCARGEFGRQPYGMETVHCLNSLHIPPTFPFSTASVSSLGMHSLFSSSKSTTSLIK